MKQNVKIHQSQKIHFSHYPFHYQLNLFLTFLICFRLFFPFSELFRTIPTTLILTLFLDNRTEHIPGLMLNISKTLNTPVEPSLYSRIAEFTLISWHYLMGKIYGDILPSRIHLFHHLYQILYNAIILHQ